MTESKDQIHGVPPHQSDEGHRMAEKRAAQLAALVPLVAPCPARESSGHPINCGSPAGILPLKREYFEQIKAGTKIEEYRLLNHFWALRLEGRDFDRVVLTLGYLKDVLTRLPNHPNNRIEELLPHRWQPETV